MGLFTGLDLEQYVTWYWAFLIVFGAFMVYMWVKHG